METEMTGRSGTDSLGLPVHLRFEDSGITPSGKISAGRSPLDAKVEECIQSKSRYDDPSFQPLTRALDILSAPSAEEELARLQADWQEVDALVDHVVALHHVEFTTSLQNYSRVAGLVKEAQGCMNVVRRCLGVAMEGVRVEEAGLVRVTKEYAAAVEVHKMVGMLRAVVDALDEVEVVGGGVEGEGESKKPGGETREGQMRHVKLLLQVGNTLAREEIGEIPAVRGLVVRARATAERMVEGLVREARQQAFFGGFVAGMPGAGGVSTSDGFGFLSGHVLLTATPGQVDSTLISCIAQLGGVDDALQLVRNDARRALREELIREVHALDMFDGKRGNETPMCVVRCVLKRSEAFFMSTCLYIRRLLGERVVAPSSGLLMLRGGKNTNGKGTGSSETIPVALSALRECQLLWEGVQRELLHVLAAALGLSIQAKNSDDDPGHNEKDVFLDSIRRKNSVDHQQGLVFSIPDQVSRGQEQEGVHVDLDSGGALGCSGYRERNGIQSTEGKSDTSKSVEELERAVKGAIGEELCSVRSSAALYLPVRAFVLRCCAYLEELEAEEREGCRPTNTVLSSLSPPSSNPMSILNRFQANFRVTLQGSEGSDGKNSPKEFLLSYLVDILRTDFVPSVFVECGHRTQAVVADMAVSMHVHSVATYSVTRNTVELIKDMLECSSMASVVAYDVIGVLQNSLGKIAESLRSQACSVGFVGASEPQGPTAGQRPRHERQSIALCMASDPKISHLMAQEPIATLVGGPEWFACQESATVDSFLSSAIASGFALGKGVLPDELFKYFMDRIPIDGSLLLQGGNMPVAKPVVSIAVIGQTAELIANALYECVSEYSEKMRADDEQHYFGGKSRVQRAARCTTPAGENTPKLIGLVDMANRYRAVSGLCTRMLRIEAMLLVLFATQGMLIASADRRGGANGYAGEDYESDVARLPPKLASMDEVLAKHLPPPLWKYVFGSLKEFHSRLASHISGNSGEDGPAASHSVHRALATIEALIGGLGQHKLH